MRIASLFCIPFCLAAPVTAKAVCPSKGLPHTAATFVTNSGHHRYDLEVAATPDAQECGLMFRKSMKAAMGMIFPFAPPRPATFWMENTFLPLDLIFVGPDGRVLTVASGQPFSREMIDSGGTTASVIELNAGEARRIGLKPGDRVKQ